MLGFPRFGVRDVLLLTAAIAVLIAETNEYGSYYEADFAFATFLGLTTIVSLAAWKRPTPSRAFFAGMAVYCVLHLACSLQFGLSDELGDRSAIGMGFAFATGVAARWLALALTEESPPGAAATVPAQIVAPASKGSSGWRDAAEPPSDV